MIKNNLLKFKSFSAMDGLVHGFSTKEFGNVRTGSPEYKNSIEEISNALDINSANLIKMEQVHGDNIEWVGAEQAGWRMLQTDSMLTGDKNIYLSVVSADCVPLLIFDRKNKLAGTIHAGWRGIYNQIIPAVIDKMIAAGSDCGDIFVGIGPCIRRCCYDVDKERADQFQKKFKYFSGFLTRRDNKYFLDLPKIAALQLASKGILEVNIEDCGICTYDKSDDFFSYRKEGKDFRAFMGIIGLR